MRRTALALMLALGALFPCRFAVAHEVRPAYLEIVERSGGELDVLFKTPMQGELRLKLWPTFSLATEDVTDVAMRAADGAAIHTWRMRAAGPLRGAMVRVAGLEGTMTDALVRVQFADGTQWTERLTPAEPAAAVPLRESAFAVARVYLVLGIEHILLGVDHLLFVLALLLVTHGAWMLIKTVTAFTVAHSITLGLATLDLVSVPIAPVEAVIALSIVFVAAEIVRSRSGRPGITARMPWLVAFIFGLLHGFGFAGALAEVGLPQAEIPVALLFFNVGVEAGQLLFIALVLGLTACLRGSRVHLPAWGKPAVPYAIGSLAMFWVIQRASAF
jgi:hypothetical protein